MIELIFLQVPATYRSDFSPPVGTAEEKAIALCDHVLGKTEDVDGNLEQAKAVAQQVKAALQ